MGPAYPDRDEWLDWVFSGARLGESLDDEVAALIFSVPDEAVLRYLTEAFERPAELLGRFTDTELNAGLWRLAFDFGSLATCLDDSFPETDRLRCVDSIAVLFRDLFAAR
jgi:hypothetical protein